MKIIKTEEELLALIKDGRIEIAEDVKIECNIDYYGFGEKINSFIVRGCLDVRGYLDVRGDLNVGGYLDVGRYLNVRGYLDVRGDLNVGGYLDVGRYLNVRGYLDVRGDLKTNTLYWTHNSLPKIGGKQDIKLILPPVWQRTYWELRLGISTYGECYDYILSNLIKPNLAEWLKSDKWTPTERWMLESYQDKKDR